MHTKKQSMRNASHTPTEVSSKKVISLTVCDAVIVRGFTHIHTHIHTQEERIR